MQAVGSVMTNKYSEGYPGASQHLASFAFTNRNLSFFHFFFLSSFKLVFDKEEKDGEKTML
jgi:hypothetical protein